MRVLAEDPDNDITAAFPDPQTGAIVGVYVSGNRNEVKWFDAAAQQRYDVLKRTFKGREVSLESWTADGSKTLALVQAGDFPPTYFLVDFTTHKADIAGEEYPALSGVELGAMRTISYPARDGTPIPAYLTMPPGHAEGPLPLVVMPHGGPESRDYPRFDWMVQFLATRGYAVLQPQFRGSTGFGEAFHAAGFRQWGGLMQDDVTDGVRAMIGQGVADPKRVCIVGASYGGYAALAGAAFTPELYACAVSINGISDLPALMRADVPVFGGAISTGMSYWRKHIGEPNDPRLDAVSPINAVRAIRAPVLLIYGTADDRVPIDQSRKLSEAMKKAGKSVASVELPAEDHWLSRTETRMKVLRELDAFLLSHL
jgi:dipeptidyl aminopeptidase/acylaminoacyl peptidase